MSWEDRAACKNEDVNLFYPDTDGAHRADVQRAKAICTYCPVARHCLLEALATEPKDDQGIRGATTKRERVKLRRKLAGRLPQKEATAA
jgi:hypothetical protein